ncbi:MAG: ribosome maturation factor RimP [Rhodospirillales bacterium]|nr:ribosome maturation factor RimP [Alphaproteobacteria bacterium]MBL6948397.1 ribosome maturation factor RimP [Rhodospirillales bacterium]
MELARRIHELIEPTIEDLGYDLVRVQIMGKDAPILQIMMEHQEGPDGFKEITVEDCATVSRAVSALLEVDDPIQGAYTLEVSSPGLDRPLVRLRDFERFQGLEAKIEINRPLDGQRRFKGRLLGVEGDTVKILVDGNEVELPHPDIHKAKLLMTDELIAVSEEK